MQSNVSEVRARAEARDQDRIRAVVDAALDPMGNVRNGGGAMCTATEIEVNGS